jgi:streptogramin lyase
VKRKAQPRRNLPGTVSLSVEVLETRCLLSPTFTEYGPLSGPNPLSNALGPDGNIWFTEFGGDRIGRITPSGSITEFPLATGSKPGEITAGTDGNLWFTENGGNKIGRITPAGTLTEFPIPTPNSKPVGITTGPDGNVWFTEVGGSRVASITTAGVIDEQPSLAYLDCSGVPCIWQYPGPYIMTLGSDNNLWYTDPGFGTVSRLHLSSPASTQTYTRYFYDGFGNPLDPKGITSGPDSAMWFTEPDANQIVRISLDMSTVTPYKLSPINGQSRLPERITLGPDNNLWFTEAATNEIGEITPAGVITEYPIRANSTANLYPLGITTGLNGTLWFTENVADEIGKAQVLASVPQTYVVTTTADSAPGSLRQAILNANANGGADTIKFNIPGSGVQVIQPASALPVITSPVLIDGTSQPGYAGTPLIELDGRQAGPSVSGLVITAGNTTVQGLDIARFTSDGVDLVGSSNCIIQGNYIGTDPTGTIALGNGQQGVAIYNGAASNRIGTNGDGNNDSGERNVISGNAGVGVVIAGSGTNQNIVAGDYIGTDAAGTRALANGTGINIFGGAQANRIGVYDRDRVPLDDRNLISGNSGAGLYITDTGTTQNVIAGNYIGTDVSGTKALGNGGVGVFFANGTQSNRVGTNGDGVNDAAERNVIDANAFQGVALDGSGTDLNVVAGNHIGVDATGNNALGNGNNGVWILQGAQSNRIGTNGSDPNAAGEGNRIGGNAYAGVAITDPGTNQNLVAGNSIGADPTGTRALGNGGNGVYLGNAAQHNQIGGSAPALSNTIAFNQQNGVVLVNPTTGTTSGNSIRGNAIFGNVQLGIDLGWDGVTFNDLGDADTGPNNLQNYPTLTAGTPGSSTAVSGTLNSLANTTFTLDFYASPQPDARGFGQGQRYLGSTTVHTDATGNAAFSTSLAAAATLGEWLTATATDPAGNTSEFSAALELPAPALTLDASTWTSLGPAPILTGWSPFAGRIAAVAADPTRANVLYVAAASGGVWKTTDGGVNWLPLTDAQATLWMGSVALAPSNPSIVYAGTGEADTGTYGRGLLKSTDGGATWTLLTGNPGQNEFDLRMIGRVLIDPADANVVYIAVVGGGSHDGIWKSTDGGATWTNTTAGIDANHSWTDLVMDPGNSQVLYAALGDSGSAVNGVYKTTDGGATWAPAGNFPHGNASVGRITLAIAPTPAQTLFAAATNSADGSLFEMLRSTDGGNTWQALSGVPNYLGAQGWYDTALAVDPSNPAMVYAGGSSNSGGPNVIESRDGGATWSDISAPHTDQHALVFDANRRLLVGSDGGLWRLDNPTPGQVQWTDLNGNLAITQLYGIALDPTNPAIVYGGTQDNGSARFNGGRAWTGIGGGDVGFFRVDPKNPHTVYRASLGISWQHSDDGGTTWADKVSGINPSDPVDFPAPYVIDSSNPARLLAGTNRVYETTNRADTWAPISTPNQNGWTTSANIDALALSASNASTIYASAGGHLFVTSNDGGSWQQIDVPGGPRYFRDLMVDPSNNLVAYAAYNWFTGSSAGHIFRTADGGQTWSDISGNFPDLPAYSIVLDPRTNVLYVGADDGVYASVDGGTTWVPFGTGLPHARVTDLELSPTGVLAAGTYGRGVFEILAPRSANHFVVSATGSTTAGTAFTVTVQAVDAAGNLATAYSGTIHFTSSDSSAALPADYTFSVGDQGKQTFSVTLKTAGPRTVAVTDVADFTSTSSTTVLVTAAAATHLGVAAPASSTAGSAFDVTVTAQDPYGNTDPSYRGTVQLGSDDTQGTESGAATLTPDDHGAYTFAGAVTLRSAGNRTVTASDTATASITGSTTLSITGAAATHLGLTAASTAIAGVPFLVTVTALDPYGNPDPAYQGTVQFSTSAPQATLPAPYTFGSSDNGTHTFTSGVILGTSGSQSVTVSAPDLGLDSRQVVVQAAAASHFAVTAPTSSIAGNALDVTVAALDRFGNIATGYRGTVGFDTNDTQATLPSNYTFAGSDSGIHTFPAAIILRTTGNRSVTVTDTANAGLTGSAGVAVSPLAATQLRLTAPPTATAGSAFDVTVAAVDPYGNADPSFQGTIQLSSSDPSATLPDAYIFIGGDNGTHTFAAGVTLGTARSRTLTVTAAGFDSRTLAITVNAAPASHFAITAPPTSSAGSPFGATVTALDPFGNIDKNYQGTMLLGSGDPQATLPGVYRFTTGSTGDNGVHTFTTGIILRSAGSQPLIATDTTTASVSGSASVMVTALPATHLALSATAQTTAGSDFDLTVSALDPFNNPDPGYRGTVHLTSSDRQATIPTGYTFTGADGGTHTFAGGASLNTAGIQAVSATSTAALVGSITVQVNPGAPTTLALTVPLGSTAGSAFDVAVAARDAFGNVDPAYTGTVHFSSDDSRATLPVDYTFATGSGGDNGTHTFAGAVTLLLAGSIGIELTDSSNHSITGRATVAVSAAPVSQLAVSAPATSAAGSSFSVTVTLLDRYGNLATGYGGIVALTSTDPQATFPANHVFTNGAGGDDGTFTFNGVVLRTAGSMALRAGDTGTPALADSATVQVGATTATHLDISAPAGSTAGIPFSATVLALDPFGNPDPTYTGSVHLGSDDPQGPPPASYTITPDDGGSHMFAVTLDTAGTRILSAADTGSFRATRAIQVQAAAATHLGVAAAGPVTAGTPFHATITALDPFGNLDPSYRGTVHLDSSDTLAVLPGDYTFIAGDSGEHSLAATLRTAGSSSLSAADTGSLTGTASISVGAAAAATLVVTAPTAATAGDALDVTVTAFDPFGNVATNYAGTIHLTSNDGRASLPTTYTFTPGSGSHKYAGVILRSAGSHTLTVIDTETPPLTAEVSVAISPTSALLTLTTIPNPAVLGQPVTLAATVRPANPAAGTPTGTVVFLDGIATLGVVSLDTSGLATLTTAALGLGGHALRAVYGGDITFLAAEPVLSSAVVTDQPVSDVTGLLSVSLGRSRRRRGLVRQTVTLTNVGSGALDGPVSVVLVPRTRKVRLLNGTGLSGDGKAYVNVTLEPDNLLQPGAGIGVTLLLTNSGGSRVRFSIRVLAGVGAR